MINKDDVDPEKEPPIAKLPDDAGALPEVVAKYEARVVWNSQ